MFYGRHQQEQKKTSANISPLGRTEVEQASSVVMLCLSPWQCRINEKFPTALMTTYHTTWFKRQLPVDNESVRLDHLKPNDMSFPWYSQASSRCKLRRESKYTGSRENEQDFTISDSFFNRALTTQNQCHLQAYPASSARRLSSNILNISSFPIVSSLDRPSIWVFGIIMKQSRLRVPKEWSKGLRADKCNTRTALREYILKHQSAFAVTGPKMKRPIFPYT